MQSGGHLQAQDHTAASFVFGKAGKGGLKKSCAQCYRVRVWIRLSGSNANPRIATCLSHCSVWHQRKDLQRKAQQVSLVQDECASANLRKSVPQESAPWRMHLTAM